MKKPIFLIIVLLFGFFLIYAQQGRDQKAVEYREKEKQKQPQEQKEQVQAQEQKKEYPTIEAEIRAKQNERIERLKQKRLQEKEAFENDIENRYQILVAALNTDNDAESTRLLTPFIDFNRTDYKNVGDLKKKFEIKSLEKKIAALPESETLGRFVKYKRLSVLDPSSGFYKKKTAYYSDKYQRERRLEKEQIRESTLYDLELLSWHWGQEYSYAIAKGEVKNISGKKMKRVEALVIWYDAAGNMITSDASLIEYNPIMPGQTSPFKVIERYNPQMKTAKIEFKFMGGGQIATHQKK